ncbi:hypothetical protein D4764_10G0009370 [Takifugu flavidus]|uniref:Uncharacterized protein n=1 Tax=Takifugu flavidus TaxID=433684 RepID=A0A5C6PNK8_9TELE|nr:hypothetical protein D4764_10G0009370 [Takifugu flavidus]
MHREEAERRVDFLLELARELAQTHLGNSLLQTSGPKESLGLGLGEGNGFTLGGTAEGRGPEPGGKAEVPMRGERQTSRGQAEESKKPGKQIIAGATVRGRRQKQAGFLGNRRGRQDEDRQVWDELQLS